MFAHSRLWGQLTWVVFGLDLRIKVSVVPSVYQRYFGTKVLIFYETVHYTLKRSLISGMDTIAKSCCVNCKGNKHEIDFCVSHKLDYKKVCRSSSFTEKRKKHLEREISMVATPLPLK